MNNEWLYPFLHFSICTSSHSLNTYSDPLIVQHYGSVNSGAMHYLPASLSPLTYISRIVAVAHLDQGPNAAAPAVVCTSKLGIR